MGGGVFQFPEYAEPGIANLFKSIGREYRIIRKSNPELLWTTAINSINAGKPVVCVEWFPWQNRGHFAILSGYNTQKKKFYGRNYSFIQEEKYASLKPENLNYILVIGEKVKQMPTSYELALNTLRLAIQMSKIGIQSGEEKGAYGLVAYERQAEMILNDIDPEKDEYPLLEHFLFWRLEVLLLCRNYALRYLDEISKEFSKIEKNHILAAKKCYEEFIKYFNRKLKILYGKEAEKLGTPLLWCDKGKEQPIKITFLSLKGKESFSNFLLKLQSYEKEFYKNIAKLF